MTNASSGPAQNVETANSPSANQQRPLSFYDLLGLRPTASVQDIRRAYRDLSKLYHPDTTELERAIATRKFQALNEAYATLSSPDKRLAYDYKIGFSRLSVMQPLHAQQAAQADARSGPHRSSNAYIDPTDRPLSAGEFFALFILGITFVCCLVLVVTLSLTRGDVAASDQSSAAPITVPLAKPAPAPVKPPSHIPLSASPSVGSPSTSSEPIGLDSPKPDLPQVPWLVPKARFQPSSSPAQAADNLLERLGPSE